jgi:hypothetical protein
MRKWYEVVFYDGDGPFPAYYLIDTIEGEALKKKLKAKLAGITQRVRKIFDIREDIPDWRIYEALYVLREKGLISIKSIT